MYEKQRLSWLETIRRQRVFDHLELPPASIIIKNQSLYLSVCQHKCGISDLQLDRRAKDDRVSDILILDMDECFARLAEASSQLTRSSYFVFLVSGPGHSPRCDECYGRRLLLRQIPVLPRTLSVYRGSELGAGLGPLDRSCSV